MAPNWVSEKTELQPSEITTWAFSDCSRNKGLASCMTLRRSAAPAPSCRTALAITRSKSQAHIGAVPAADTEEDWNSGNLGNNTESDRRRQRDVIESADHSASDKPEYAVAGRKQPKSRCSAFGGHHRSNRSRDDRFMDPHPEPPDG